MGLQVHTAQQQGTCSSRCGITGAKRCAMLGLCYQSEIRVADSELGARQHTIEPGVDLQGSMKQTAQ